MDDKQIVNQINTALAALFENFLNRNLKAGKLTQDQIDARLRPITEGHASLMFGWIESGGQSQWTFSVIDPDGSVEQFLSGTVGTLPQQAMQ